MSPFRFQCESCGQWHENEVPLAYGPWAPVAYLLLSEHEREKRAILSKDLCVVDNDQFYICGNLRLPILGSEDVFSWDVWVSLSHVSFERTLEIWENPGREQEPPFFGWLSSQLPFYPETLSLKTSVQTRPAGYKPWIELEPSDHPLAIEQREGIPTSRVIEFARQLLHPQS